MSPSSKASIKNTASTSNQGLSTTAPPPRAPSCPATSISPWRRRRRSSPRFPTPTFRWSRSTACPIRTGCLPRPSGQDLQGPRRPGLRRRFGQWRALGRVARHGQFGLSGVKFDDLKEVALGSGVGPALIAGRLNYSVLHLDDIAEIEAQGKKLNVVLMMKDTTRTPTTPCWSRPSRISPPTATLSCACSRP